MKVLASAKMVFVSSVRMVTKPAVANSIDLRYGFLAAVLCLGVAVAAHADATIKQTTTGKGLGLKGTATGTSYIKGNKMRTDLVLGDRTQTSIYDLDAQKMYIFDSKKNEAEVWDMAAFSQQLSKFVDVSSVNHSFKPNGQTKQVGGHTAEGYDMEVSLRSAMPVLKNVTMTVTIKGPVWIVKNSPGSADYNNFHLAAFKKGWIFSNPRAAQVQPGQAKAMAELYKEIAAIGGLAYETDMQIKLSGEGPLAALFNRMGNIGLSTAVTDVQTGALADDLFAPPAGYKLIPSKY